VASKQENVFSKGSSRLNFPLIDCEKVFKGLPSKAPSSGTPDESLCGNVPVNEITFAINPLSGTPPF
jgi:hypothetical protein